MNTFCLRVLLPEGKIDKGNQEGKRKDAPHVILYGLRVRGTRPTIWTAVLLYLQDQRRKNGTVSLSAQLYQTVYRTSTPVVLDLLRWRARQPIARSIFMRRRGGRLARTGHDRLPFCSPLPGAVLLVRVYV